MTYVAKPWQRVFAELVGTAFFVFAVASSVVIPTAYLGAVPGVISLVTAFIQGLALVAIVSIFSAVSGSHFNPAITAVTIFIKKISIILGLFYIAAQIVGAILGAAIFRGAASFWEIGHLSAVGIGIGVTVGQAFLMEFMITTILLAVVLGTSVDTRQGIYVLAPVPIGFAVLVGVLIARTITGASMNPARALGTAIVSGTWNHQWLYWVAPLTSAMFVSLLYYLLFHINPPRNVMNITQQGLMVAPSTPGINTTGTLTSETAV
jgi:MIP family channel proteins